jgi:hypothetical protein
MDEATWLTCSDPVAMLDFVAHAAVERKLRLFACACCRRVWHLMGDERCRRAVEGAEAFADGRLSAARLERLHADAFAAFVQMRGATRDRRPADPAMAATNAAHVVAGAAYRDEAREAADAASSAEGGEEAARWQCDVLRDLFTPFSRVRVEPAWLAWAAGTVPMLARSIHEEAAFDRMPILGDALEDAGCADEVVLAHCRSRRVHARGCWLIEALLAKK